MAKELNKDATYRAAKSKDKDYMINDGGGLYLFVSKKALDCGDLCIPSLRNKKSWH